MSIENTIEAVPPVATDFPSEPWRGQTLRLLSRWLDADTALITAEGSVDASNADRLDEYVQRVARRNVSIVLDLGGLEFFGTAGFSALKAASARSEQPNFRLLTVPSGAVARVLRICDHPGRLATVGTVDAAMATLQGDTQPVLALVAQ